VADPNDPSFAAGVAAAHARLIRKLRPSNRSSRLGACLLIASVLLPTGRASSATFGVAHPAQWPALRGGVLIRPAIEKFLDGLLRRMTLEQKIGQMVQADIGSITPNDLLHYPLGSVLAGGFAAPGNDIHSGPAAWRKMAAQYKAAALSAPHGAAPAIPLIFGIDAVHGDAKIRGATIFPHNIGLGAAHDPALLRRIGAATAQEVAATGIDWAFAPTVAVARDVRWGRSYESYSDDPKEVASYAAAMVQGLQGALGTRDYLAAGHVLASAKHFLGDGGTENGRDQGNDLAPEAVLRDVHGAGYMAAIRAGVASVMASYNSWQGVKMHADHSLLVGVLKQRWGFDGFVIGDWNAQEELPGCSKFSCPAMVNAGIDMVMAPDGWKQIYLSLLAQARDGEIPLARIDDAARRILRVKALAGLIGPLARPASLPSLDVVGSPAHRALARQAVRESLVLLKNARALLPLSPRQNVLVVGPAADSIGQQAGGWTVDWQGATNRNTDLPGATSILAGIRAAVTQGGGTVAFSPDGSFTAKPDVAIMVYGELPYAEFEGDRENLLLPNSAQTVATLQRLHDAGVKVVSVLLSGRPLWVNPELNRSDAFVAAWLPGSEGEGVADMLFAGAGLPRHDFTGRLSFPWPLTAMPVQYSTAGEVSGALFPRGYGLAAGQLSDGAPLPEDPHLPAQFSTTDSLFAAGHVIAPWSIYAADTVAQVRMTLPSLTTPAGTLTTRLGDGAVTADWSGAGEAVWSIGGRPADLSAPGQALRLTYRVTQALTARMQMGLLCGAHCGAWLNISPALSAAPASPPGGWRQLTVPLACFAAAGADPAHAETPLALRTAGRAGIEIRSAMLIRARRGTPCPHP
jgi:beta-glucosidase